MVWLLGKTEKGGNYEVLFFCTDDVRPPGIATILSGPAHLRPQRVYPLSQLPYRIHPMYSQVPTDGWGQLSTALVHDASHAKRPLPCIERNHVIADAVPLSIQDLTNQRRFVAPTARSARQQASKRKTHNLWDQLGRKKCAGSPICGLQGVPVG